MSIFHCNHCDQDKDGDYDGCEYDPSDPSKVVCTECEEEIQQEMDELENPMRTYGLKEGDFL